MTAKTSQTHSAESPKSAGARARAPHDALEVLSVDHREVEDLFGQFEKARTADRKQKLAAEICAALKVHTQIEEDLFYPAARQTLRSDDLLDEAAVEHGTAKSLIEQIETSSPGESMFDAKVMVLSEYIKHHVKEEETELFPRLKKADIDLVALGDQLTEGKAELMEKS